MDHLQHEQKSSNFKGQLQKQYHRASIVIGTPDSVWYQKDQEGATPAAGGGLITRSMSFSSSSVRTPLVKRSASSPVAASPSTGGYSSDGISPLTANTKYLATPPDHRMGGGYANTPLLEEDEEGEDESDDRCAAPNLMRGMCNICGDLCS